MNRRSWRMTSSLIIMRCRGTSVGSTSSSTLICATIHRLKVERHQQKTSPVGTVSDAKLQRAKRSENDEAKMGKPTGRAKLFQQLDEHIAKGKIRWLHIFFLDRLFNNTRRLRPRSAKCWCWQWLRRERRQCRHGTLRIRREEQAEAKRR